MSKLFRQRLQTLSTLTHSSTLVTLGQWMCIYFILGSCISPYAHADQAYTESLVIQGMVTDEPGPYEVTISKTIPIENQAVSQTIVPEGVTGATVTITDDLGNSEELVEKSTGYYYTKTMQGVVGRSYFLTVVSANDGVYKSSVQKLLPVGDLDVSYEFVQVEDPFVGDQITSKNGFQITINSKLDPGQEGRVWWRTLGTYHVETYPQAKTRYIEVGRPPVGGFVPAPPLCAFNGFHKACTCCDCWISVFDQVPRLSDPRFISNGEITGLKMGFVPATRRTMFDKYVFEIQQMSVSQDVYNFWKTVAVSASNSSNLFQTPPPKTVGNIVPQNSSSKTVLGYFAASSIKRRFHTFTKLDVPYKIYAIDNVTESCLLTYRNSTTKKPTFW